MNQASWFGSQGPVGSGMCICYVKVMRRGGVREARAPTARDGSKTSIDPLASLIVLSSYSQS
jgi:hypothetical protein